MADNFYDLLEKAIEDGDIVLTGRNKGMTAEDFVEQLRKENKE
ncbi:MAG: hypothetical protein ACRDCE_01440 [Cetobacterium sp.]